MNTSSLGAIYNAVPAALVAQLMQQRRLTCWLRSTYQIWNLYLQVQPIRRYKRRYKMFKIGWFWI